MHVFYFCIFLFLLSVSYPVAVILLHCGSFCHYNKFLVCVNNHINKAHSHSHSFTDSFSDSFCTLHPYTSRWPHIHSIIRLTDSLKKHEYIFSPVHLPTVYHVKINCCRWLHISARFWFIPVYLINWFFWICLHRYLLIDSFSDSFCIGLVIKAVESHTWAFSFCIVHSLKLFFQKYEFIFLR